MTLTFDKMLSNSATFAAVLMIATILWLTIDIMVLPAGAVGIDPNVFTTPSPELFLAATILAPGLVGAAAYASYSMGQRAGRPRSRLLEMMTVFVGMHTTYFFYVAQSV